MRYIASGSSPAIHTMIAYRGVRSLGEVKLGFTDLDEEKKGDVR